MTLLNIFLIDKDEKLKDLILNTKRNDMYAGINEFSIEYVNNFKDFNKKIKNNFDVLMINPDLLVEEINIMEEIEKLRLRKIPTIVIMDKFNEVEKTIDMLSSGAFDYFLKQPARVLTQRDKEKKVKEILDKILLGKISFIRVEEIYYKPIDYNRYNFLNSIKKIIVMGSSTGGPQTLEKIIPNISKDIPSSIIIVQHMPKEFTKKLAERLDSLSMIKVKEASDGEELIDGVCYIAKGGYHLVLEEDLKSRIFISLNKKEKILGVRPSIDITMESASKIFKHKAVGVILTGMGTDGTIGAKKIKERGGTIIVQSEKTSIIFGMPKSVINKGYYDEIVDLENISHAMLQVLEV